MDYREADIVNRVAAYKANSERLMLQGFKADAML